MAKLSAKDVEHFVQRLRARRAELREHIRASLLQAQQEDFTALAGRVHDAGEASVADLLTSMNLTQMDREVSELREVEEALTRVRAGTYGRCLECGGEIGRERLEANPTATRCIECQQRREIAYAGGRDQTPSL